MNNLAIHLQKYIELGLKDVLIKKKFIKAVKEVVGVELDSGDIEIKDRVARVNLQGPIKTEIFLKRKKIENLFIKSLEEEGYNYSNRNIV